MSDPPSKPLNPRLYDLQQPEKLSKILSEDKDDCLSCRLVGQYRLPSSSLQHLLNPRNRCIGIHRTWRIRLLLWETRIERAGTYDCSTKWTGCAEMEASGHRAPVFYFYWHGLVSTGQLRQERDCGEKVIDRRQGECITSNLNLFLCGGRIYHEVRSTKSGSKRLRDGQDELVAAWKAPDET